MDGGAAAQQVPQLRDAARGASRLRGRLTPWRGRECRARRPTRSSCKLLGEYEEAIADAPTGKPFQECYDVMKVRPQGWYLDQYKAAKEELHGLGVEFPY